MATTRHGRADGQYATLGLTEGATRTICATAFPSARRKERHVHQAIPVRVLLTPLAALLLALALALAVAAAVGSSPVAGHASHTVADGSPFGGGSSGGGGASGSW
jgi:hypothetical protein